MACIDETGVPNVLSSVGMDALVLVEKDLLAAFFAECDPANSIEPGDPTNYISQGFLLTNYVAPDIIGPLVGISPLD